MKYSKLTIYPIYLIWIEYAAAFFLLGDRLKDAVNVCLKHLDDFQLAIAIARVYEGKLIFATTLFFF